MVSVNEYRTNACGEVGEALVGKTIRAAGWVENIRDHGGIQFIDLRDHYGVLQVVIGDEKLIAGIGREWVVSVEGTVRLRDPDTVNPKISTGTVELVAEKVRVLGDVTRPLPFEVPLSHETREEVRLKYRFLDLRNKKIHDKIVMRSALIAFLRAKMAELGFLDIQTPILTASSPEGARDYLIPSRRQKGKFYALPQAPQIFKQLLMVSGFDKYFQIAPCFRDEDARADRSPGEFYQLDFEMAFATQDDVFAVAEAVMTAVFEKFSDKPVSAAPYPRIPYREAMLRYGSDKPDLRNPLFIIDLSDRFVESGFAPFKGKTVRAIRVPGAASRPKSFFEQMLSFATSIGMKGLGYVKVTPEMTFNGPIDKFLSDDDRAAIKERAALQPGDVLYFIADTEKQANAFAGQIRNELGRRLELLEDGYRLCFITDFPMYEQDDETGAWGFPHNPFSMPQGGLEALNTKSPGDILAYQYDIVCNGVELSSGAVRNHEPETMVRAFHIAGYDRSTLEQKFPALFSAFHYGAPPHAGMAPGVDRLLMLLTGDDTIREVIPFPMNAAGQDVLMGAPCEVTELQLREAHIKIR